MANREQDRETESRRIIDRVMREAESGGSSMISRTADRARDHMSAADRDPADRIEYWGTRIGRILGLVLCAGLLVWLATSILQGM